MIYLLAGARAAMRHASRQSSCSDGIIARSADARPRTSIRCALPAHADQKEISAASRLHRRPGSADFCRLQNGVPPSELRASRPRHHASERWSGRWITLSLATLASVTVSKTAPDKTPFVPRSRGLLEPEPSSHTTATTTTQSCVTRDFPKVHERPRIGGDLCDGSFSETASLQSAGRFCAFFSGPEIPFPGNGDRERQRLGSNAGYAEGSPSIWCCRDHSADMSARRATPMP